MEKESGFDMFPVVMVFFIAAILGFMLYIVSLAQHDHCHKRLCPSGHYPAYTKETGCKCVLEASK